MRNQERTKIELQKKDQSRICVKEFHSFFCIIVTFLLYYCDFIYILMRPQIIFNSKFSKVFISPFIETRSVYVI